MNKLKIFISVSVLVFAAILCYEACEVVKTWENFSESSIIVDNEEVATQVLEEGYHEEQQISLQETWEEKNATSEPVDRTEEDPTKEPEKNQESLSATEPESTTPPIIPEDIENPWEMELIINSSTRLETEETTRETEDKSQDSSEDNSLYGDDESQDNIWELE